MRIRNIDAIKSESTGLNLGQLDLPVLILQMAAQAGHRNKPLPTVLATHLLSLRLILTRFQTAAAPRTALCTAAAASPRSARAPRAATARTTHTTPATTHANNTRKYQTGFALNRGRFKIAFIVTAAQGSCGVRTTSGVAHSVASCLTDAFQRGRGLSGGVLLLSPHPTVDLLPFLVRLCDVTEACALLVAGYKKVHEVPDLVLKALQLLQAAGAAGTEQPVHQELPVVVALGRRQDVQHRVQIGETLIVDGFLHRVQQKLTTNSWSKLR